VADIGLKIRKPNEQILQPMQSQLDRAQARATVKSKPDGQGVCTLSVPDIRCGSCVAAVERALNAHAGIISARVNLTRKQATVVLETRDTDTTAIIETLAGLGYNANHVDILETDHENTDIIGRSLLRAIAVAGFGAANIMLLSVAVWSGADGQTRETFHLISALIAIPVVSYAGQPFFKSAASVLKKGRTNMDVPISLGVIFALLLSLFEAFQGGEHVFFDAAVTLLLFLLAGRYLDHLMRQRARSAVSSLARLSPRGAMVRQEDGTISYTELNKISSGSIILIAPGEPVPVDAQIIKGETDLDRSLVTGEAMPIAAGRGDTLESGTLNLTGSIEAMSLCSADDSFLAQMMRMQTDAEAGRGKYVRIADRAARLYAPVVHVMALATFIGWMLYTGGDWQRAAFISISVLIITCPCALGLAVPVAHVVAAGRLMRMGILMKDGSALERLAEIDTAVFDKTGTITTGTPIVKNLPDDMAVCCGAKALAIHSRHPAARAIATRISGEPVEATDINEVPGFGVEAIIAGKHARLGRKDWVSEMAHVPDDAQSPVFAFENSEAVAFDLSETLRSGASNTIKDLKASGINVALLSGDTEQRVSHIATLLGIANAYHGEAPGGKVDWLNAVHRADRKALMVGDGLNDTAALSAAYVSMAPATASDAGRMAADFVFLRGNLNAVSATWRMASDTARIVQQNFGLAIAYNCIAIPFAVAGWVTPLIAALAMSASSILVIGNALRLNRTKLHSAEHASHLSEERFAA
jgi:Cu2+-exporting ATPase